MFRARAPCTPFPRPTAGKLLPGIILGTVTGLLISLAPSARANSTDNSELRQLEEKIDRLERDSETREKASAREREQLQRSLTALEELLGAERKWDKHTLTGKNEDLEKRLSSLEAVVKIDSFGATIKASRLRLVGLESINNGQRQLLAKGQSGKISESPVLVP